MPSEYFGITTVASPDGNYIAGFAQSGGNAATSQTSLFIWRVPQSQPEGYDGVSTIELNPHTPTKPNTRPGN
jgi:hypothetical protein